MHKEEALKLLFIINPISGGKSKSDWETAILAHFKEQPHTMEFYLLNGESDTRSVRYYIDQIKPDRVVGVGGDGTIKMLAELLYGTDIPLGILPAGSANGMARELGLPLDAASALEVVTGGVARPIDLIELNNNEKCIHLSDIGLNAMLVKYFEASGRRGWLGYAQAVFRVLWEKQLMRVHIQTDAEEIERRAFMVVIANARTYGTGAVINPEGDIADGRFEIVVMRRLNMLELFKMLVSHKPFHPNRIEIFHARQATLTTQRKAFFQVDGEYLGRKKVVEARILPGAVMIVVPKEIPQSEVGSE